jgi:hypothetical protein
MPANRKQRGSNILNVEAYTGKCPVQCDVCYVNFGRIGRSVTEDTISSIQKSYARSQGWKGGKFQIWLRPAKELYDEGSRLLRLPTGWVVPAILRVSTVSDSSYSKKEWCRDILQMWGTDCFFNSSIRAVRDRPENLVDVFHKVVITTNGGFQRVWEFPKPRPSYAVYNADLFVKLVRGSMKAPSSKLGFASFLEPKTLSDIGLEEHESKVKFYRLRCLPTIVPRIETDRPVVHTVVRFVGVWNACEFARRYGIDLRVESADAFHVAVTEKFGFKAQKLPEKSRMRIFMRLDDEGKNTSSRRNEESILSTQFSWLRPTSKKQLSVLPYVCDRSGKDCKGCGLCATLDGTERDNINPVMKKYGLVPVPFISGYVESPPGRAKRNPEGNDMWPARNEDDLGALGGDFFKDILEEAIFCANEDGDCTFVEKGEEWITRALVALAEYASKDFYFVESWNAHENAETLLAYCFWALARKTRRMGLDPDESWQAIEKFVLDSTDGKSLLEGNDDLMLVFDNAGPVVEEFGPIDDDRPVF